MIKVITFLFFLSVTTIFGQNTIGLLSYEKDHAFEGYNLFFPHRQSDVFLLNNCGEIVHKWEDTEYKPGNSVYLQDNGDLIRCGGKGVSSNPALYAGGAGDIVERSSWDGDLLWRFNYNDSMKRMHHDVEVLPNNNILILAWEKKFLNDVIQNGRDTSTLIQGEMWPDHIIEVQPLGIDSGEIVWEWHAWDHLVQEYDTTKSNYGVVSQHPERIDVNYDNNGGKADWMHSNSIDYNEELDQILISVPTFNEIWIIDHSTTTAEAASHSGGNSNKGGDLIYRWGNPQAYHSGDSSDQKLFFQHDAQWNKQFLSETNDHYNDISVFNNRINNEFSSVNVIRPNFDNSLNTYEFNQSFLPSEFEWEFVHPDTNKMFSSGLSSVQKLPNNNTLICSGRHGYFFEINSDNDIVWEYKNPLFEGIPAPQGFLMEINKNIVFSLKRYPVDYPAFTNRDLSSKGFIETDPNEEFCETIGVTDYTELDFNLYMNSPSKLLTITFQKPKKDTKIEIFDQLGSIMFKNDYKNKGYFQIDTSKFKNGIYFIRINREMTRKISIY